MTKWLKCGTIHSIYWKEYKKIILCLLIVLLLSGCSSSRNRYGSGGYIENEDGTYDYYEYPEVDISPYDHVRNW